jgi:chromosome segregation protein
VHLKSLTLRGFKSFASTTTLRFEPGVTCVVGPNGSGKSNVVDAIAWVLGEQGAKSLRGGKMEDVIFAGTPGRPPLGRAEVVLTIDNSDGALPVDDTEVTISRLMYRSGSSEYAINATPCRLLDVQELLSDSGIGRELHVIVGQGQLDAVLHARPEERRAFVEEAAGVLKHRRRKEKALRKLDAMQANLARLTDLTAELRRQLGPLGRQAEVARRAAAVQAELRDARLRLLAADLVELRSALAADLADETAARERRGAVEEALAAASAEEAALEEAAAHAAPRLAAAAQTWYRLASLTEQVRGLGRLATERARHLAVPLDPRPGRDPAALDAEAAQVRAEEARLGEALAADRDRLEASLARRRTAEESLAAEERRCAAAVRAVADRREGMARLAGQVSAARGRVTAAEDEAGRLAVAATSAQERKRQAEAEFAALETEVAGLDEGEVGLDCEHEAALAGLDETARRVDALRAEERDVERERAALSARREALRQGLETRDGAATLAGGVAAGVLGRVSSLLVVEPGAEVAVAAALGAVADGVAVADLDAAVGAVQELRRADGGRATLLVGGAAEVDVPAPPPGATAAVDLVRAEAPLAAPLRTLLAAVVIVDTLDAARAALAAAPDRTAVTRAGEVVTAVTVTGGSAAARTRLETQGALDETERALAALDHRAERLRFAAARAEDERAAASGRVEETLARLHESDAALAAVAERLGELAAAARAAAAETERLEQARRRAIEARDREARTLHELQDRLAAAGATPLEQEPDTATRAALAAECTAARGAELDARLAVRTGEERVRALAGRADALLATAAAERAAVHRADQARSARARHAARATAVAQGAEVLLARVDAAARAAAAARDVAEAARTTRDRDLSVVRARVRELTGELEVLTDAVHRDEVARAELRMRIEATEAKAAADHDVPADALLAEFAPGEDFDRAAERERAARAERALARLGRVNPLALEEYAALEERHAFLAAQRKDLEATRRDLLTVVREVDERVEEVFRAAFEDTAREFETVFATLFPGGQGRLVLTDPTDLLTTGIEVEARPAGKRVSRLSLLSGGERSLTAIALLVAIFRARPSPFYVLDEVEAALDDRNLRRLVALLGELRAVSQLIVITHQKKTMEVADALYGVTMRADGVTAVISQRLREPAPASA